MEQKKPTNPIPPHLSNRALVQRFLLDHQGYFFTVTQLRDRLTEWARIMMNPKTIRAALKEIDSLGIGLECQIRRTGRRCLPIKFYSIKK